MSDSSSQDSELELIDRKTYLKGTDDLDSSDFVSSDSSEESDSESDDDSDSSDDSESSDESVVFIREEPRPKRMKKEDKKPDWLIGREGSPTGWLWCYCDHMSAITGAPHTPGGHPAPCDSFADRWTKAIFSNNFGPERWHTHHVYYLKDEERMMTQKEMLAAKNRKCNASQYNQYSRADISTIPGSKWFQEMREERGIA